MRGGLGNQLFQIFALENLAFSQQRTPVVNLSWYDLEFLQDKGISSRKYELQDFPTFDYISLESKPSFGKIRRLREQVSIRSRKLMAPVLGYQVEFIKDDLDINRLRRKVDLMGYFIKGNQLRHRRQEISTRLNTLKTKEWLHHPDVQDFNSSKVFSIHVRLADYTKFPDIFGVTNLNYFRRAIELLETKGAEISNVWVFTDDCAKVKEFLGNDFLVKKMKIMCQCSSLTAVQQLLLMSRSNWLVCSNSTFSWWAGFLSNPSDTSVVFPSQYMKGISSREYGLEITDWHYL
jgi:hypothetical protein